MNSHWQFSLQELLWLTVGCAILSMLAWLHFSAIYWGLPIVFSGFVAWRIDHSAGAVVCGTLTALFWTIALTIPAVWLSWILAEFYVPVVISLFAITSVIGITSGYVGARMERSQTGK